ncbi:unnamed protein product [Amaranthus hypochondriacus]
MSMILGSSLRELQNLSRGVAVIKVGATTETELEDRKLCIEDAKNATFAAKKERIVLGDGAALVHLSTFVPVIKENLEDADERSGFNVITGKCEDLIDLGVIDHAKVIKCDLQNASFVAGMILTTQAFVVEKTKAKAAAAAAQPGLTVYVIPQI